MQAVPPPAAPTPLEPGYAEVRRLDLKGPFHTKAPWSVYALAPTGPDAEIGDKPVKICFQERPTAKPDCTAITSGLDNDTVVYRYQTLGGVGAIGGPPAPGGLKIEDLAPGIKGVVAKATFSGGGSGTLTQTVIWTYSGGKFEGFFPTSATKIDNLGEDRRFASGPLAGYYVTADFIWGDKETHWSLHRFTIDAYKLAPGGGYLRVLSYVTTRKYPAERQTEGDVIDHELSHLKRLLTAAYPTGASF